MAPSRGGEGTVHLFEGVLEARQESEHDRFLRSRELAGGRERERKNERKKDRHRDRSSDGAKAF